MISGIGAIMDRAFDLLVRYRGAVLYCILPAIALKLISWTFFPGRLATTFGSDELNDYGHKWLLYSFAATIASFSLWFCASALMFGVQGMMAGGRPSPLSWLVLSGRRVPALLATFVPFGILQISVSAMHLRIGSLGLKTVLTYDAYATLFAVLILPLATIILAGTILGNVSVKESFVTTLRTWLSRGRLRRFLTLSVAMVLIRVFLALVLYTISSYVTFQLHALALTWQLVWSLLEPSVAAYVFLMVAVAWISGYIGPREQTTFQPR
jgi:hypothetical protein